MSYRSRLYNHRNAQAVEANDKPFFSKQHAGNDLQKKENFFQAKLSVNAPGDKYEQEADSVASAVVNNKTAAPVVQQKNISNVQKLSTPIEDEKLGTNDARMAKDKEIQEKPIQRMTADPEKEKMKGIQKMELPEKKEKEGVQKMDDPEKEKMKGIQKMDDPKKEEEDKKKTAAVQTKQDGGVNTAPAHVSSKIESSTGKGNGLPKNTLHEMGSSFGADFSNVRIHNDSEAATMNQELQAQAFTHGSDIYFNDGKYAPENKNGKLLLAHELTHVLQQNGGASMINRACLPAADCPAIIPGSAEDFGTGEVAREVGPRARRKRMTCSRALSTIHAGHALQLEKFISAQDPSLTAKIHGIFIDADLSSGTGAMVTDCSDWVKLALPAGCTPPALAGAVKPCVFVQADLNQQALKFNKTAEPIIGGFSREDWRISTIQALTHEVQHVVFDTAGRPEPAGVAACPRATVAGELTELNAIMSEFPIVFRAVPAAAGPARVTALTRLDNWFTDSITNPSESLAGTLRAMRCACNCAEVEAHVRDIFNLVTATWAPAEKTAFNTELRKAKWNIPPVSLKWPL